MYSQNNEEDFILKHLENCVGNFLDIGAYDGKKFSNTRALVELGWGGVLVEPSPTVFVQLLNLYRGVGNIHLVNSAIGVKSEVIKFYDTNGDALSSSDTAHIMKWVNANNIPFTPMFIKTMALSELFDNFGYGFDFINLDVEGMNFELFKAIPFNFLPLLKVFCIEHDKRCDEILEIMTPLGFREVLRNHENLVLVR